MKGDFTRFTFNPANNYSRVLQQQGRVQLDSDWNEQADIFLYHLRALARDLVGHYGGPAQNLGFKIINKKALDALIATEQYKALSNDQQAALAAAIKDGNLIVAPGIYYVDGIRVENPGYVTVSNQAKYGNPTLDDIKNADLIYLEVWERHLTYLDDDSIREAALGGLDTTTRTQVVWRVGLHKFLGAPPHDDPIRELRDTSHGRLRARAKRGRTDSELCVISPESRYRGAENQLYRVEIHRGSVADTDKPATFKWSRENGSIVFPVLEISNSSVNQTEVTLAMFGRDARLGLKESDWVELANEESVEKNQRFPLLRIASIDRDNMRLTLDGKSAIDGDQSKRPILRRWDHQGKNEYEGALSAIGHKDTEVADAGTWIDLEDGIQIWFSDSKDYRAGDFWLIPARTATGDIEWLKERNEAGAEETDANIIGMALSPHGPRHYYAPLALINNVGALTDLRVSFKLLVGPP